MNRSRLPFRRVLLASSRTWAVVPLAALMAVVPTSVNAQEPDGPGPNTVWINAVCAEGDLSRVSVEPWTLHVPVPSSDTNQNAEVAWVLRNSSPDSIAIQAKESGDWPFGLSEMRSRGQGRERAPKARMLGKLPKRGRRGESRDIVEGVRFSYNIIVYCTVEGETYTKVVDPDIDIGN